MEYYFDECAKRASKIFMIISIIEIVSIPNFHNFYSRNYDTWYTYMQYIISMGNYFYWRAKRAENFKGTISIIEIVRFGILACNTLFRWETISIDARSVVKILMYYFNNRNNILKSSDNFYNRNSLVDLKMQFLYRNSFGFLLTISIIEIVLDDFVNNFYNRNICE